MAGTKPILCSHCKVRPIYNTCAVCRKAVCRQCFLNGAFSTVRIVNHKD